MNFQCESLPERGGDSLSPYIKALGAGDKLSLPRKAELDAVLGRRRLDRASPPHWGWGPIVARGAGWS